VSSAVAREHCRDLFTDTTIAQHRQACDVHAGDWTVVLSAVPTEPSLFRRQARAPLLELALVTVAGMRCD
jgi:hypothetical protein